jgi:hypothetical protein
MAARIVARLAERVVEARKVSLPTKLVTAGAAIGATIGVYECARNMEPRSDGGIDGPEWAAPLIEPCVIGGQLAMCAAYGATIGAVGVATTPLWLPYMAVDRARTWRSTSTA